MAGFKIGGKHIDVSGEASRWAEHARGELGKLTEPVKNSFNEAMSNIPGYEKAADHWASVYEGGIKNLEKTRDKASEALASPTGSTIMGTILGGPLGALAGYASTKENASKLSHALSTDKPIDKYNLRDWITGKVRPNADPLKGVSDKITGQATEVGKNLGKGLTGSPKAAGGGRPDLASVMESVFGQAGGGAAGGGAASGGNGIAGPTGAVNAGVPAAQDLRFADAQNNLMTQLQGRIDGTTPSLAEMQQKQAGNKALQNTLGAVRSGLGANAALSARTAALAGGNQMADLAANSAMLRLKEQQDAQSQMAALAAQMQQAQLAQQQMGLDASKTNQAAALSQMNMQNQMEQARLDAAAKLGAAALSAPQTSSSGGGGLMDFLKVAAPVAGTVLAGPIGGMIASGVTNAASNYAAPNSDAYAPVKTQAPNFDTSPSFQPSASLVGSSSAAPDVGATLASLPQEVQKAVGQQVVQATQDRASAFNAVGSMQTQGLNAAITAAAKKTADEKLTAAQATVAAAPKVPTNSLTGIKPKGNKRAL